MMSRDERTTCISGQHNFFYSPFDKASKDEVQSYTLPHTISN